MKIPKRCFKNEAGIFFKIPISICSIENSNGTSAHWHIVSERFPQINKEPVRSLPSPAIVYGDIGPGIFIEFDS